MICTIRRTFADVSVTMMVLLAALAVMSIVPMSGTRSCRSRAASTVRIGITCVR
jgi:hypothetical protein